MIWAVGFFVASVLFVLGLEIWGLHYWMRVRDEDEDEPF